MRGRASTSRSSHGVLGGQNSDEIRSQPLDELGQASIDISTFGRTRSGRSTRTKCSTLRENVVVVGRTSEVVRSAVSDVSDLLGFRVSLYVDEAVDDLSEEVRDALTSALNEALSNVLRHAGATVVNVGVRIDEYYEEVVIVVLDNGRGFDSEVRVDGNGTPVIAMAWPRSRSRRDASVGRRRS